MSDFKDKQDAKLNYMADVMSMVEKEPFTVRKIASGVGVEKTFPVNSPNIASIQVVKKGQVRRAKLYFLRKRLGQYKIKERR